MKTNRRLIQLIRRVVFLLASNEALWVEVRALAEEFGAETKTPDSTTTEPSAAVSPAETVAEPEPQPQRPLTTQQHELDNPAPTAARCRLKAEDCLRKSERQRPDDGEMLAGNFEALAAVLTVAASSLEIIAADRHLFEEFLKLVAEAQSAVREAVRRVGGPTDPDQVEAFWWVRRVAAKAEIFIERYMRDDDPADPTRWNDLLQRIKGLAEQIEQQAAVVRRRRRLFQKLRHQIEQAVSGDDDHLWESVARTLDELIVDGVHPSNLQVRELLLPHLDVIPQIANPPKGFELVLRETRRFQESLVGDPPEEDVTEFIPINQAAADMLQGRAVVLIGGDSRPAPKEALERRLRMSELVWVPTKHGQSVSSFESYVARSDVAVVLLAIRWASHAFTDVRHICRKYDKPLVRLPGGYSPNQVAIQLLNQCSWRLKQSRQRAS